MPQNRRSFLQALLGVLTVPLLPSLAFGSSAPVKPQKPKPPKGTEPKGTVPPIDRSAVVCWYADAFALIEQRDTVVERVMMPHRVWDQLGEDIVDQERGLLWGAKVDLIEDQNVGHVRVWAFGSNSYCPENYPEDYPQHFAKSVHLFEGVCYRVIGPFMRKVQLDPMLETSLSQAKELYRHPSFWAAG